MVPVLYMTEWPGDLIIAAVSISNRRTRLYIIEPFTILCSWMQVSDSNHDRYIDKMFVASTRSSGISLFFLVLHGYHMLSSRPCCIAALRYPMLIAGR